MTIINRVGAALSYAQNIAPNRMMACADVHLGNMKSYAVPGEGALNSRALDSFKVFASVAEFARRQHIPLTVAGDLFDYPSPESLLLAKLRHALTGVSFLPMLGNHDQHSTLAGDNALEGLGVGQSITVPSANGIAMFVPFKPEVVVADYLRASLKKQQGGTAFGILPRVLVIHAGIADDTTPAFMLHKADDFIQVADLFAIMDEFDIRTVLAGNWHTPRVWSRGVRQPISLIQRRVIQLGALVPTGFDNPGLLYGVHGVVRDTGASALSFVNGPRFVNLRHSEPIVLQVIEAHLASRALEGALQLNPATGPTALPPERVDSLAMTKVVMASPYALSSFAESLYVNVKAPPGADTAAIRADAEASILGALSVRNRSNPTQKPGTLTRLAVVPDARAASAQHEAATRAALHNRSHFREAVETYLDKMEVPEGVDRGAVLGRVLTYLGRTT